MEVECLASRFGSEIQARWKLSEVFGGPDGSLRSCSKLQLDRKFTVGVDARGTIQCRAVAMQGHTG